MPQKTLVYGQSLTKMHGFSPTTINPMDEPDSSVGITQLSLASSNIEDLRNLLNRIRWILDGFISSIHCLLLTDPVSA